MNNFDGNFHFLKPSRLEYYFTRSRVVVSRDIESIKNNGLFKTMISEYCPKHTWLVKIARDARIIGKIFWENGKYNWKKQNNQFETGEQSSINAQDFLDYEAFKLELYRPVEIKYYLSEISQDTEDEETLLIPRTRTKIVILSKPSEDFLILRVDHKPAYENLRKTPYIRNDLSDDELKHSGIQHALIMDPIYRDIPFSRQSLPMFKRFKGFLEKRVFKNT